MKKILSLILAGLMTVSCAAFVAADDAAVEATDPAQEAAIEFLADYGIFKGYDAENTGAEDDILRYQMALFVARISTGWVDDATWEDGTANDSKFTDLEGDVAKYLGAISYANQNGIIEGYSATKFAPNDNITYRDALTMVVRTLGYKGLSYPWGNIEKAVELGLTEGVDAAYTDVLTRGEVALIIYNALFAETAKGETLAKAIFDVDFAWTNIIIVSTDEYSLVNDTKEGKKVYAPAAQDDETYVGFKTIDEDGTIGDKVYYVKAKELGLSGHEEEVAVGSIYVALFEESGKDNFVTLKKADSALIKKTVENYGITDNEGNKFDTLPIAEELKNYKLVKSYTNGVVSYEYDDLKVYGYSNIAIVDVDGNADLVGIDWATQNIVVKTAKDLDEDGTIEDGEFEWVPHWFYNSVLEKYYKYGADEKGEVYINWMSDAEFTKWYNEIIVKNGAGYWTLGLLEAAADTMISGKNPYSKLDLYNIDAEADYDIANYKDYAIGMISVGSIECGVNADGMNHSSGKYNTYKVTDLDGGLVYEQFIEEGHAAHENEKGAQFAWLNVAEDVTTFDPAVGGVVLYDVNAASGEIEIVKHITAGENDDADSKIITGILQAYSTKYQTVTIDGVSYKIDYDNLSGDMYAMANTDTAARMKLADELDKQYMQYVSAVICDGIVVDTDLVGEDKDFIVVLGYAGVTSDGYIAVYGYKTDDLAMKVYKINSYNGWKKGDYRYNPSNADIDDAFDYGSLYQVRSYDDSTKSYGVYTENISSVLEGATPVKVTFEKGYRVVQEMTVGANGWTEKKDAASAVVAPTITKMEAADKYIIVSGRSATSTDSKIFVYDGIIEDAANYSATGYKVNVGNDKVIVIYADYISAGTVNSGFLANSYDVGYVLYEKANGKVLDAAYDEAIAGDFYLLGSTASQVTVMNLLTGEQNVVIASSNVDLRNGHVYKTIGNQILWDVTDECKSYSGEGLHAFVNMIRNAYTSTDLDYADYIVKPIILTKSTATDVDFAKALGLVSTDPSAVEKEIAKKLIDDSRLYYTIDDDQNTSDIYGHGPVAVTKRDALADDTTYIGYVIYNVANGKTVVYIAEGDSTIINTAGKADNELKEVLNTWYYYDNDDTSRVESELTAELTYDITYKYDDGKKVNKVTLDTLTLSFSNPLGLTASEIAKKGYFFGIDDELTGTKFGYLDAALEVAVFEGYYTSTEYDWDSSDKKVLNNLDISDMKFVCAEGTNMVTSIVIDLADVEIESVQEVAQLHVSINATSSKFTSLDTYFAFHQNSNWAADWAYGVFSFVKADIDANGAAFIVEDSYAEDTDLVLRPYTDVSNIEVVEIEG